MSTITKGNPKKSAHVALDKLAIVRAEGNVDRSGIEACDYLITRAGPDIQGAVVDLSQASHVDYRATVILVARRRVLKARGGELAIAAGKRDVRDIIRTSSGNELQIFPTVDEAISFVRGEGDVVTAGAKATKTARR